MPVDAFIDAAMLFIFTTFIRCRHYAYYFFFADYAAVATMLTPIHAHATATYAAIMPYYAYVSLMLIIYYFRC